MANDYVPLNSRKKDELVELCEGFGLEIPADQNTKNGIIALLEENGITNKTLKVMETEDQRPGGDTKEEDDVLDVPDDKAVVVMDRPNPTFGFKQYRFTETERFKVMDKEDARELIDKVPGFRIASVDEIMRAYRP